MNVAVATAKSDQSGVYEREDLLTGCQAVAQGVRLADVDVIAAYPIRPYTEVMDNLSKLIADGQLDAEYIIADSEHSQFEIVKHASSVGARAFARQSAARAGCTVRGAGRYRHRPSPVLFLVGNRALDDPGAFGVEHNDAMAVRDMGWLLCWVTTAAGGAGARADRLPHRRGQASQHADGGGDGWRLPHPLAAHGEDPVRARPRRDFCRSMISPSAGSIPTTRSPSRRRPTRTG